MAGLFGYVPARVLVLPISLMDAYHKRLSDEGLGHASSVRRTAGRGATGGQTSQETVAHLAERFTAGSGRAQYLFEDPDRLRARPSYLLRAVLSDGRVTVVDLGCGTGAMSLGLLSALAATRRRRALPRFPLSVRMVLVDFAPKALDIYRRSLDDLRDELASQGIEVTSTNELQADLFSVDEDRARIRAAVDVAAVDADATIVLVGALSDALRQRADPLRDTPVNDLLLHLAAKDRAAVAVWVEPGGLHKAARTAMERLGAALATAVTLRTEPAEDGDTSFLVLDPLDLDAFVHEGTVFAKDLGNQAWFQP